MKFHGICNGLHIAIFDPQLDDFLPKISTDPYQIDTILYGIYSI